MASHAGYEGLLLEVLRLPPGTWKNVRVLMFDHRLSWPTEVPPMAGEIAIAWLEAPTMKGYALLTFCVDTKTWAYFAIYNRERLLRVEGAEGQSLA